MSDLKVGVVIPAAGRGTRLGGPVSKQYRKILDKPLLMYSLEAFLDITWINKIILVVDSMEKVQAMLQEFGYETSPRIVLVKGRETRHRSIKAGVLELQKQFSDEVNVVVVHDGARPIVPPSLVMELVRGAEQHGAAGAVRPLVSTVLRVTSDSFLADSLDRSLHVASETPQAFQLEILTMAYNKCSEEDLNHGTECLALVLKYCGTKAKLIPGPEDLWKVTHKQDLYLAAVTIKRKNNNVCIISTEKNAIINTLVDSLNISAAQTVRHVVSPEDTDSNNTDQHTFNIVICFHQQEIQDTQLVDFAPMLDTVNQGLIIHVIWNASVEGLQTKSVYSLQKSGRSMSHHYDKLRKGVVVIHCISGNEESQLISLLTTLVQADPLTFSGQTLFI
ncbi:D-ribitol-5-phosphate cytidylyltransferase-like [Macrosteles quadrilineatus]|uniref:D-ribitol-5-phosphate cytidylyltransferase-like n=1 Tax=Macrosteles quadrilineatus TaxID=74068 RepID=UPI0023E33D2B|nr:D-ribitol-5-phosphate cytidylyltransferase-like [Macrosteles quadrilineatus]